MLLRYGDFSSWDPAMSTFLAIGGGLTETTSGGRAYVIKLIYLDRLFASCRAPSEGHRKHCLKSLSVRRPVTRTTVRRTLDRFRVPEDDLV
jgi:hypothetical protein